MWYGLKIKKKKMEILSFIIEEFLSKDVFESIPSAY